MTESGTVSIRVTLTPLLPQVLTAMKVIVATDLSETLKTVAVSFRSIHLVSFPYINT